MLRLAAAAVQDKELELIREQNKRDIDQRRATCSDPTICAPT